MIRVMLAATTNGEDLRYPLLASPKYDGIRAFIHNGVVMSRNAEPIPNEYIQTVLGKRKYNGLDGELMVGPFTAPDAYRVTQSGVRRIGGRPEFTFNVFDKFYSDLEFHARLRSATRDIVRMCKDSKAAASFLRMVPHVMVNSKDELISYEAGLLVAGWEGVMLRDPAGLYKQGRSTALEGGLLKLKRFTDEEAVIVGCDELKHNDNEKVTNAEGRSKRTSHKAGKRAGGVLGALKCKSPNFNKTFSIGTGFDQKLREQLWAMRKHLPGRIVKFKHMPIGAKDRPRIPVFLGFRDAFDT